MKPKKRPGLFEVVMSLLLASIGSHAFGQAREPVLSLAKKEKPALLETLKALVSIESGSRDDEVSRNLRASLLGD
jgi:glutamate carboxypeptidase